MAKKFWTVDVTSKFFFFVKERLPGPFDSPLFWVGEDKNIGWKNSCEKEREMAVDNVYHPRCGDLSNTYLPLYTTHHPALPHLRDPRANYWEGMITVNLHPENYTPFPFLTYQTIVLTSNSIASLFETSFRKPYSSDSKISLTSLSLIKDSSFFLDHSLSFSNTKDFLSNWNGNFISPFIGDFISIALSIFFLFSFFFVNLWEVLRKWEGSDKERVNEANKAVADRESKSWLKSPTWAHCWPT